MDSTDQDHHAQLRSFVRGSTDLQAATEMLIRGMRGRFAAPGNPWMAKTDDGRPYIDFDALPDWIGPLSGGERRFLMVAASIGSSDVDINLAKTITYLDYDLQDLALDALRHAGGRTVWTAEE